jgi:nicotinate-nucleotide adenylyltransferase
MTNTSPFLDPISSPVALFGGSFNPPHFGHLRLAEELCETLRLTRVVFVPSANPPHKSGARMASAHERSEMLRLACAGNKRFEVSDIEIKRDGPSYTVDTLAAIPQENRERVYFVLGSDSLREIHTWKDYERLFTLCNFVVVTRPGLKFETAWACVPDHIRRQYRIHDSEYLHGTGLRVIPSSVTGLDISSTMIRGLIGNAKSVRYLTPEPVRIYIQEKGIYWDHT